MLQKSKATQTTKEAPKLADDPKLKETIKDKFLTAEELKLTELQYTSLIKTLGILEKSELKERPRSIDVDLWWNKTPGHYFDMHCWWAEMVKLEPGCGTCCCIGGTAERIAGQRSLFVSYRTPPELGNLFYKYPDTVTQPQAGRVLRNYLETGVTDWSKRHG